MTTYPKTVIETSWRRWQRVHKASHVALKPRVAQGSGKQYKTIPWAQRAEGRE